MYNLKLTKYYNVSSTIHNINPLCKIICILIFTFLSLFSKNILYLIILLLFLVLIMFMSNVPLDLYINNLKFLLSMIIFIFIINLIFSNIYSTILSIVKLILLVLYSQVLLYTTKPNDLTYGLEEFLSPLKVFNISVSSLALTISLSLRFIPTIFTEADKILKAQISRGLNFNGNLSEKCDKIISVIFPIFNVSLKKALDISYVLDMRLYRVDAKRSKYKSCDITFIDNIALVIHIFLILLYLIWR